MNFLQICQRTARECSITGAINVPSTVVNQSGELRKIVDWCASAYLEICNDKQNWKFLRSRFSLPTVAGKEEYPIEESVTNILKHSEDFSNADWNKIGTATVTGTNILNLPTVSDALSQGTGFDPANKTVTFQAKLSGSGTLHIWTTNNVDDNSEVKSVTLTSTPTIYFVTYNYNSTSGNVSPVIERRAGDTATQVTIDFVQLEQASAAGPYVKTVESSVTKLASFYTDTKFNNPLTNPITADGFAKWITEKYDTFRIYLTSAGAANQQHIWPIDYQTFRFLYQNQPPPNGFPVQYAIREDDNAILLGPKPNDIYTVTGEYYRRAPALAVDADIPLFPERFHEAIVWRAVRKYAQSEEDGGLYAAANLEHKRYYGALLKDQLPRLRLGGPLA